MVTRLLKYEADVSANTTDQEIDSKSPGSNKRWEVQEVYGDTNSSIDYSLSYEERKLFDNIPGDEIADEDNGIPFDLTVGASEDLALLGTNGTTSSVTARFYVRVDETGA